MMDRTEKEKQELFIENIEELIKNERWETINMQTSIGRYTESQEHQMKMKIEEYLAAQGYTPHKETG